jgi:hypothetical protein
MNGNGKRGRLLVSLGVVLMVGLPGVAAAQVRAVLYEIVENLDLTLLPGHRVSNWTAQGTTEAASPFCPAALLPPGVPSCTITAFGMDAIDLSTFVGTVWANVGMVANLDNIVDGTEGVAFTGQITGDITIFPPAGGGLVAPDLNKNKQVLGPLLPLIYVTNGKFFPDASPAIRTSPPSPLPSSGATAHFDSTFRLPFKVGKTGVPQTPERGQSAYYLGDDGSLIRVHRQNEFALGFPLLRAEVFFK